MHSSLGNKSETPSQKKKRNFILNRKLGIYSVVLAKLVKFPVFLRKEGRKR